MEVWEPKKTSQQREIYMNNETFKYIYFSNLTFDLSVIKCSGVNIFYSWPIYLLDVYICFFLGKEGRKENAWKLMKKIWDYPFKDINE